MYRGAWTRLAAAASAAILAACVGEAATSRESPIPVGSKVEQALISLKQELMSADYRADMDELVRLRDEASSLADDPASAYIAYYWAGFAGWRLAMNGASRSMSPREMRSHLVRAAGDFLAAIRHRSGFADAYAAAGSTVGWLAALNRDDPVSVRSHVAELDRLLALARNFGPDNPRVLWVLGSDKFARPKEFGGNREEAVTLYRRALALADQTQPQSPLPDWGKAEAHMALANVYLTSSTPDLDTAATEARAALRLQPEWSYVRDTLLPQIEREQAKRTISVQ